MDDVPPGRLASVAAHAARAGGDYLAEAFRNGSLDAEYGTDDVKVAADRTAERRILDVIREAYPDHAVHAEESGRHDGTGYEWVVDPLDGTNNFASGIPAFASAVAVLSGGEPVASVIYEPLPDTLYLAQRGSGASVNGRRLRADSDLDLERGTVSFVVGLDAVRDATLADEARRIEAALRGETKRVVQTWSPCVDWGLVASGALEGIVCFHPDRFEQHAGALLAAESGVASVSSDSVYVGASRPAVRDALRTLVADVR